MHGGREATDGDEPVRGVAEEAVAERLGKLPTI
jgi:hypothetical protein